MQSFVKPGSRYETIFVYFAFFERLFLCIFFRNSYNSYFWVLFVEIMTKYVIYFTIINISAGLNAHTVTAR